MGLSQSKAHTLATRGYLTSSTGDDYAAIRAALSDLRLHVSRKVIADAGGSHDTLYFTPDMVDSLPESVVLIALNAFSALHSIATDHLAAIDDEFRIKFSFNRFGKCNDTLVINTCGNTGPRRDTGMVTVCMYDRAFQMLSGDKWVTIPPYTLVVRTGMWLQRLMEIELPSLEESVFGFKIRGNRDLVPAKATYQVPAETFGLELLLEPSTGGSIDGVTYSEFVRANRV